MRASDGPLRASCFIMAKCMDRNKERRINVLFYETIRCNLRVMNDTEGGGGTIREAGGQVRFYPYKKGRGQKKFMLKNGGEQVRNEGYLLGFATKFAFSSSSKTAQDV